jgi:uncharacterized protein YkwD
MDYFTRHAGKFRLLVVIATLCKPALILAVVVPAVLLGTALETGAKTYLEIARGSLKNLPGDSRLREDLEAVIASQANAFRQSKGVKSLQSSRLLRDAARAQAIDMMLNGYVGHRASTGQEFDSRIRAFLSLENPFSMPQMAENAARDTQKGEADPAKARRLFQQWVESRPHRKTLLNSAYTFVSTGVVQRGNKIWAVQIFFAPLPEGVKVLGSGELY